MKNWSYKVIEFESKGVFGGLIDSQDIEKRLNELGSLGWEVVSTITTNEGNGKTKMIVYTLKKEI
ncbi:DUF4177 domain-containing protein [Alkaliphilus transvaalensis]|uniref:DUF4177 domain-containing protein n=1 Tax=Alkaliphilus transvaalensis TaxID=114628 RepID=UPI00047989E3|nr:DUF4177 domain-containing protein [Alkaliphilus transvaalensis]